MKAGSNLERILKSGQFAITAEFVPPATGDRELIERQALYFKGHVDAANVADNMGAVVGAASCAVSKVLLDLGLEPIMSLVTRDRNRIALQSDLLGASLLGIRNVFCTTGDHQKFGDHPEALNVYDIDSVQLVNAVRGLSDSGKLLGGAGCDKVGSFFVGAAADPFGEPADLMILCLGQKVRAGADFIQSQPVFDLEKFGHWVRLAREEGLIEKCSILATVMPLRSAREARAIHEERRGVEVSRDVMTRLEGVLEPEQAQEGLKICAEQMQALKEMKGVQGIHIMSAGREEVIPELIKKSGLETARAKG
ncbi:MAG: methylenetetrahydrofolate reductase [Thermodesulfobacteriota bacterium]|nr:methylenetetrahydrofolate reductase [Thermodesulfobacteriota bacterium]